MSKPPTEASEGTLDQGGEPERTAHWRQLDALLAQAQELPVEARERWLQNLPEACRALAPVLRSMLARAEVETDDFMSTPAGAQVLRSAGADFAGDTVGPYRLIREIGAGGMGTVWLAERADGSLQRKVALKLPQAWGNPAMAERMARERDILSKLEHPHIARLYDAGLSANGRPFLAMEYVAGEPIDQYVNARLLSVTGRLRLFLQVAQALSHAHARLVVHRDLKPSNILVTANGAVSLLDFGVAKLLATHNAAPSQLTQAQGRSYTPDYASPEQIRGEPLTVASDIYSLGVVLYELLTGERPYRLKRDTAAALEEAIVEADAPLASSRLSAEPRRARALRGDIDTLLAKALKKDPAQRYESVEAMAADVQRHLEGRPLLAQPDSWRYRAGKFVQRHRVGLAATVLTLATGLVGVVGTLSQAQRAKQLALVAQQERDAALNELNYAEAAQGFMSFLLTEGSNKPLTTADLLARADQVVDVQYAGNAAMRARMQMMVADLFGSLKNYKQMAVVLERAKASADIAALPGLSAQLDCQRAGMLVPMNRLDEAGAIFARVMPQLDSLPAGEVMPSVACYGHRAQWQRRRGEPQAALADSAKTLQLIGEPVPARLTMYTDMQSTIAVVHSTQGQNALAAEVLKDAVGRLDRAGLLRSGNGSTLISNLAVVLWNGGQVLDAAQTNRRGLGSITPAGLERDHVMASNYARVLIDLGQTQEALQWLQAALVASRAMGDAQTEPFVVLGLAGAHCARHEWSQCDEHLAQVRRMMVGVRPPGTPTFGNIEVIAAQSWFARGDMAQARALLNKAMAIYNTNTTRAASGRSRALALLARLDVQAGELDAARQHAQQSLEAARVASSGFVHSEWVGSALLAQAIVQRARSEAGADESLQQALQHLLPSVGENASPTLEARRLLASR
jgi:eukaryotic-like serine/threonine-protein kinase